MSLKSMTGYGRGEENGYIVSLSSTNRKQFDAAFSVPKALSSFESKIVERVRARVHRGRVTGTIQAPPEAAQGASVNLPLAKRVLGELRKTGKELGITDENFGLADLLRIPDVLVVRAQEVDPDDPERGWAALMPAIDECLDTLIASREAEGRALAEDLAERLKGLEKTHAEIAKNATGVKQRKRDDLHAKLKEAGLDIALDDERLVKEIAIYAERADINEEIKRIASHFRQVRDALKADEPVGRGLDFLCQELNREINTIGSKSSESGISKLVIDFKTELERFREQVQNIE